jgi:hypothetical protein
VHAVRQIDTLAQFAAKSLDPRPPRHAPLDPLDVVPFTIRVRNQRKLHIVFQQARPRPAHVHRARDHAPKLRHLTQARLPQPTRKRIHPLFPQRSP